MSLFMENYNLNDKLTYVSEYYMWISLYPAFTSMCSNIESVKILLAICLSMYHLGIFMGHGTWPVQLLCGDPMSCWRGQYLYSHGYFYNANGNCGSIIYVTWYLLVK